MSILRFFNSRPTKRAFYIRKRSLITIILVPLVLYSLINFQNYASIKNHNEQYLRDNNNNNNNYNNNNNNNNNYNSNLIGYNVLNNHQPLSSSINQTELYQRRAAYGYALQWYNARNPHFNDFSSSGGDCANFVSQCLIAGGLSLHKGTDGSGYGVYPDRDRTIVSNGTIPYCDYLDLHLKNYQNTYTYYVEDTNATIYDWVEIGDVIIFGDKTGDKYKHAMIVVTDSGSTVGLAGHSSDVWDRDFFTELGYFSCATIYHFNISFAEYHHFRVTASVLNVRVGPGKNGEDAYYTDIGNIHQNEEYIAFDSAIDTNGKKWWHFWFDERSAWCASWYTEEISGNTPIEVDVSSALNVRDGPGTGYAIFGQVFNGTRYVSDYLDGSWYRFWYQGEQKYSYSTYFKELDESQPEPAPRSQNKTVMGFLPYWVSSNQNFTPLTHLAWFGVDLNADGSISNLHGWPDSTTVSAVHAADRKVVLTATMFSSTDIHTLISTPSYRTTAVNNLLTQVQNGNADGINIDFEHPKSAGDDANLIAFMSLLNSTFKAANPNYHVSLCTPSVDWWNTYDYGGLAPHVDAFMIMGYGYYYSGSSTAGPTAPLYGGSFNLDKTVNSHISGGAPANKLILGLPFYGYDYPVTSTSIHADTRSSGSSITYSANLAKIDSLAPTVYYDEESETPWYNYYVSGDGWHQVWCDDRNSLDVKMNYILKQDLGGLGIWAWGYQGNHAELEQMIMDKFHADTTPPNITILSPANQSTLTNATVRFEWEGSDNVYIDNYSYSIDNGATWVFMELNTSVDLTLNSGEYNFTVIATDRNNNSANTTITFWVDITPPDISIIAPQAEAVLSKPAVYLEWSGTDNMGIANYSISLDSENTWIFMELNTSTTISLENGQYNFTVLVFDINNNSAKASINFTVNYQPPPSDTTPPTIILLNPQNNTEINVSTVIISWNPSDDSGIATNYLSINNGVSWLNLGDNTTYTANLSEGEHSIGIRAVDLHGLNTTIWLVININLSTSDLNNNNNTSDGNNSDGSNDNENQDNQNPGDNNSNPNDNGDLIIIVSSIGIGSVCAIGAIFGIKKVKSGEKVKKLRDIGSFEIST